MSTNLFGRSYETVGSSNSDYLIKTKGQIKIQYGSKYIDLIKDGKINVDSKFIFKDNKVGVKDGIYLIEDGSNTKVVLQIKGQQIDLSIGGGNTFVSFLENQESTSDQKYNALKNIGFIYDNSSEINENSLQNGLIYIESEQKLYIVKDGYISEYTVNIPNPYPKQFVIQKNDNNKGSLLIKGSGINNSLQFDSVVFYTNNNNTYIDSSGDIYIQLEGDNKILISENQIVFSNKVISEKFQSQGASDSYGFRLYTNKNGSTLEVDNLIVRNNSNIEIQNNDKLYPQYWYTKNNIISEVKEEITEVSEENTLKTKYLYLTLIYDNQYNKGDYLYSYVTVQSFLGKEEQLLKFVIQDITDNTLYVSLQIEQEIYSKLNLESGLKYQTIFLIGTEQFNSILRRSNQGIDILQSSNFEDEQNLSKIQTRLGNIEELNLKNSKQNTISGNGIYSTNACFLEAQYINNYNLPSNDSSGKFASTEWVNNRINTKSDQWEIIE